MLSLLDVARRDALAEFDQRFFYAVIQCDRHDREQNKKREDPHRRRARHFLEREPHAQTVCDVDPVGVARDQFALIEANYVREKYLGLYMLSRGLPG